MKNRLMNDEIFRFGMLDESLKLIKRGLIE
jgi:hypothetical protein